MVPAGPPVDAVIRSALPRLTTGDIIVEIDGKKVHDTHELLRIVAGVPVGKTVVLKAVRDGRLQNFNITVAERKDQELASAQERSGDYFGMTPARIYVVPDALRLVF